MISEIVYFFYRKAEYKAEEEPFFRIHLQYLCNRQMVSNRCDCLIVLKDVVKLCALSPIH